jgi:hypothetical protein
VTKSSPSRVLAASSFLLIVLFCSAINAVCAETGEVTPCVDGPIAVALSADDNQSVKAIPGYSDAIGTLLEQERFKELDCIADQARASKARFSGGIWKLAMFYNGLSEPKLHPTSEDWQRHLDSLDRWVAANPDSITARIALAESYQSFAWDARGNGFSNTVSESGWRLFGERTAKARQILEDATKLPNKCPEWFLAMQRVGQQQSWSVQELNELLKQATAFEPSYYHFYRSHAELLLPKWFGEVGDSERFAEQVADQIGGEAGDILYAQIASRLICGCGEEDAATRLSWPRIQRGFAAIEKKYGMSYTNLNSFAFIAIAYNDSEVANKLFPRIGDQRNEERWQEGYFQQSKEWAAQMAQIEEKRRSSKVLALASMATPAAVNYSKLLEPKVLELMKECQKDSRADSAPFKLVLLVDEQGVVRYGFPDPVTATGGCVVYYSSKTSMPPAPSKDVWVMFDLNPKTSSVALHDEQGK